MGLPPPILISIVSILVILIVVFFVNGRKKLKKRNLNLVQFIIGICIALIGAGIMFHGNIFGERNSGIATVIGIIGIGLIATAFLYKSL